MHHVEGEVLALGENSLADGEPVDDVILLRRSAVPRTTADRAESPVRVLESTEQAQSTSTPINLSNDPGESISPAMAADGAGNVYLVWVNQEGPSVQLMLTQWDGVGWSTPEALPFDGWPGSPDIAVSDEGVVHLVWTAWVDDPFHDGPRVFYSSGGPGGWSTPIELSSGFTPPPGVSVVWLYDAVSPAIAVDHGGVAHVAWEFRGQEGEDPVWSERVYYGQVGQPAAAISARGSDLGPPAITVDSADDVHVVWGMTDDDLVTWLQHWQTGGVASNVTNANHPPMSRYFVGVDDAGQVHIVWDDSFGGDMPDPGMLRHCVGDGSSCSESHYVAYLIGDMAATLDPLGHPHAVWYDYDGVLSGGWDEMGWPEPVLVSDYQHPPNHWGPYFAMAADISGTVHMAWTQVDEEGEGGGENWEIYYASKGEALPLDVEVSANALTVNDEGWYTENPLVVTVTLTNDTDEMVDAAFDLSLASPEQTARFYVYDADFWDSDRLVCPTGSTEGNDRSFRSYDASCSVILEGSETYSARWWVWVQPSVAATLEVSATWGVYNDAESVTIPQAQIHPVVFVHGILGSMPPGQKLWAQRPPFGEILWPGEPVFDPFLKSYYPMLDHLEAMGYEWGQTLFGLAYDWRDSNDVSAGFLRDRLGSTVIPQSSALPYVTADGKTDLVVHSMGGLVSRAYIQGGGYNGDVRKVVFVASPHRGFASDYRTREGLTWSDYFANEVPLLSDLKLMTMLMDGILWPHLIEERYDPSTDEIEEDCTWVVEDYYGAGHWDCRGAYYAWTHDDSRGVPSLYEMLPTQNMDIYLFSEEGQPWPCSAGVVPERNHWLEGLNANISNLEARLGLDNIYVLYSEAYPNLTDIGYIVKCKPSFFGHWLYGKPVDEGHISGDDLIPVNSTSLIQSGLLPALPTAHEFVIADTYGHKGIVYAPDAQSKITEFLADGALPGTAEYVAPFAVNNLMRIIAIIVGSPVEIMVTDPAGQRVGYDPATEEMVAEIPDAYYTGQGDVQFMLLYNTLPGEYQITATGTDAGEYELETYVVEESGVRLLDIFTGTVTAGQVANHTAAYTTTSTTLFFDDVESGPGNWAAEGGWSPGTETAHSPVTAWGSGAVTPSQPLTLTLLPPLDLSTARMASLTFWHTFSLLSGGRAQVELSTDGGATWQTVATQQGGEHGWTPATLSLTRFAGPEQEPLRLRFRLLPGGPDDCWWVDDVLVEAPEPPSLFDLPFEDDVEGWRKWEGTGDWAVVTDMPHDGEQSWEASQDGSALTLAGRLDLQEASAPRLSFWHLLDGDGATGVVEVSPDGTTWLALTTVSATEGDWWPVEVDLSEYAGQMIHLRFRLSVPDGGNWHLDDLAAWEAIPPVVHSLPFDDDMEEPEANWRVANGWEPVTATAHSGATAWRGYTGESALILVDQLDLTDAVSPTLTFWQRFDLPEGSVGRVQVTTDDALTWLPVLAITEPVSDWTQVELDLSSYAGQRVGLAFVLEEVTGEGAGSARLEPAVPDEGAGKAQPGPVLPGVAALPLVTAVLAGVTGMAGRQRYRRLGKHLLGMLAVLAILVVGWLGCNVCGLWRYVPPLRTWKINHLDVVEGGKTDLIVSAARNPSRAYPSPDGRWMSVYCQSGEWLLLDTANGTEERIDNLVGWLEDDLFVGEDSRGYFLMAVPGLEKTRLGTYRGENGIGEIELLRRADRLYAVEDAAHPGSYVYIVLDEAAQYVTKPPGLVTLEDEKALLEELPQAVIISRWPYAYATTAQAQWGARTIEHTRYYSPDGTLYAQGENPSPVDRTPYLEIRTTEGDELIARARKRNYAPVLLGWSADGQGFYFQMHTGAVSGVLTPESPVYLLRLPDTLPVSTPTLAVEGLIPGNAQLLPVSYLAAPAADEVAAGWYVDDVVVQEATAPPLAPFCGDLVQTVNYVDGGYAAPCSGISPVFRTLKLVDSACNPIAGARVNLRNESGGYITYKRTDADGVADFSDYDGSAVPSLFEVDYHGATYRTVAGTYATGSVVQTREYHLQFIGSDCSPIENARVNLRKSSDAYVTYVRTDGEGVASFQVVPEAQMKLEVDYHGAKWLSEANTANLDVVLGAEGFRLLLIDSTGDPVENARVNLRKANDSYVTYTRTGADGLASFDVVPGGELKLEVDYHGATYSTPASTSHAQETVQTLAFSLRLIDSTGQPIENARVNLRKANGSYVTYARTGSDGVASFEVVPEAQMKLEVDHHGATYATPVTEVSADTQLEVQTLAFSLRLIDSAGQPIENARVNLRKANGSYVTYARTGSDGVASFEVVPEAQMKLEVDYHGATYATPVTEVGADTQLEVQTLAFSLRLTDSAGQPIEDARVNLRKANDSYVTYARTGSDGVASFEVVPEAQMKLEVDYHGATYATPVTEVSADTQLEMQTVALTVHLTVQGNDLADQRVGLLKSDEAYVTYTRTGSDGRASFEVLPEAEHKLRSTYEGETWVSDGIVGPAEVEHDFS